MLNNNITIKPKNNTVKIENTRMTQREFYTELEDRETLIKKLLIENLNKEGITEAR